MVEGGNYMVNQPNVPMPDLDLANREIVAKTASESIALAMKLLEHFYYRGEFDPKHPLSRLFDDIFQAGELNLPETALGKKLLAPMEVFFARDRFEEDDMPPSYFEPGKFISLANEGMRVSLNIFGPVRKVAGCDVDDVSTARFVKQGGHAVRTENVADHPAVLRLRVRFSDNPSDEFTMRFQAASNRLLFAVLVANHESRKTISRIGRNEDQMTCGLYDDLVGLSGRIRNIPYVGVQEPGPEFKPV